ncbi:MAG: DUF4886 domain-containing protein [Clostridia bacterium]|nr:DUF4886 domain-containing protein [Clostridia bacterium]
MKVLFIGNSFSQDACEYMAKIAKAGNFDLTTVNLVIGGCSLERHCSNIGMNDEKHLYAKSVNAEGGEKISLDEALTQDKYDVVSIQQASPFSGLWETYVPFLEELVAHVRELQPEAKIAIHQTWAYEADAPNSGFANYERDRHIMHAKLYECYKRAAELIGADIFVPVGNLIANLRESWMFDPAKYGARLTRDGFHLSMDYGRYAAALMWCATLGMKNIEENDFVPPMLGIDMMRIKKIKDTVISMTQG